MALPDNSLVQTCGTARRRVHHGAFIFALTLSAFAPLSAARAGLICLQDCSGKYCGTVFRLAPDGTETVLHRFSGPRNDGSRPYGSLIMDSARK